MLKPTTPINENHRRFQVAAAPESTGFTRRGLLSASAVMASAGLTGSMSPAFGQQPGIRSTNEQVLGPFYPVRLPADHDADLTLIAGKDARALGQVVYLSGRAMNLRGEPVADAELELWQANAVGRYNHPSDQNPMPVDPNFEGYAKIRTGLDGSWQIKTVKPGAYPATPSWTRPPHNRAAQRRA